MDIWAKNMARQILDELCLEAKCCCITEKQSLPLIFGLKMDEVLKHALWFLQT